MGSLERSIGDRGLASPRDGATAARIPQTQWARTVDGARIAALAGPSEVLVSSTVKDLVAGSGLQFAERGENELKGVPGSWRLYAVKDPQ
jgi:class 3 adenylate cyclase